MIKITTTLIIFAFFLLNLTGHVQAAPQPIKGKTLKVTFDTTNLNKPIRTSAYIQNHNPEQYATSFMDHFYIIEMRAKDGSLLMTGHTKKQLFSSLPLVKNAASPAIEGGRNISPNKLVLNLPYFQEVDTVILKNESGQQVLGVDVSNIVATTSIRFAECNSCGYCLEKEPPENVDECMKCLYPGLSLEDSLRVDPDTGRAASAVKGKYYTQLGCLDTGVGSFSSSGAAGGVLNFFMTRLLFPITGILALLGLIYGSFLLVTSQDNPEQIQQGRLWIIGSIVGALFIFSSVLLVQTIGIDILQIPGMSR